MNYKTEEETTTKRNIVKICFTSCQQSAGQNFVRHSRTDKTSEQNNDSDQQYKREACGVLVTGLQKYKKHRKYKHNQSRPQGKRQQKKKHTVDLNNKPNDVDLKTPRIKKQQNKKKRKRLQRCFVCCHSFPLQKLDIHMHSFVHHQAIEKLKGSEQIHKCWACDMSMTGIQQYKMHISTANHKHLMAILNRKTNKSIVHYNIDDELKDACVQRDQEKFLKRREKWKRNKGKKAECQQLKEKKFIQNDQTKNKSQSVHFTIPVRAHAEFTNDEVPLSCYFSSWEGQQNSSTSRPDQKRRQESMFDLNSLNCPVVKRLYPPSKVPAEEISARVECPTPNKKVARICTDKMTSKNELAFIDLTCSPKSVKRDDGHISTMFGTIKKSTDYQNVNIGSELSVKSCTKKIVRQTCKSNYNEEMDQQPETSKMHERKERLVKGTTSKKSMSIHSPEESRPKTCSNDVTLALRNKQNQINANTKLQQKQDMRGGDIKGPEASAVSLEAREETAEKIRGLDSKTSAAGNDLQIQKVQPKTEHVTLESPKNFQSVPSNLQKPRKKKQEISNISQGNPEANDTSRQENVTKLMTMCKREENLRSSLENVGEQLFQAYSTLQNTYTEVQRLLAVKQQVTSEMASLRAKRIKILQGMKDPCQSNTDVSCEDLT